MNGVLGDPGAAILATRGDMAPSAGIASDGQPLNGLMHAALHAPEARRSGVTIGQTIAARPGWVVMQTGFGGAHR